MKIHLYTQFYNERAMAPFFYLHYKDFIDRFFLFDDQSNDGGDDLLRSFDRVNVEAFAYSDPDSYILSCQLFNNNIWKRSRGKADWVILANMDEHIFLPDVYNFLKKSLDQGVSILETIGYQMLSRVEPVNSAPLFKQIKRGARFNQMDKCIIFNPNKIKDIGFKPGRHNCRPSGDVVFGEKKIKLLHYKLIGIERSFDRNRELSKRLQKADLEGGNGGWGRRYNFNYEQTVADFNNFLKRSEVLDL